MLVSGLIPDIRDVLGDEDGDRWADSILIKKINQAQKNFCRRTRCLKTSTNIVIHSGQSNYTMPSDNQLVTSGSYNTTGKLAMKTQDEIVEISTSWETDTAEEPTNIIYNNINRGIIRLYPIPTFTEPDVFDLATANKLTVYYIKKADDVTLATDELELNDIYFDAIVYFVSGMLLRNDKDTQNRAFGGEQLTLYESEVTIAKKDISSDFTNDSGIFTVPYRSAFND